MRMGEAVYLKTACLKCGGSVEFPEESEGATVLCPHCGKDLFLYRGVRAVGTPPANQPDFSPKPPASTPVLWNPRAAAFWGFIFAPTLDFWLFSPAFGAFLHAKNAESLGRAEEAKANWVWFYVALVYLGFVLAGCFILPTRAVGLSSITNLVLFFLWYGQVGRKQVKYVNETWQKNYQKKSFGVPLLIAFGCWVVIVGVGYIAIVVAPAGSQSVQNQSPPQPEAPQPQRQAVPARSQFEWNTTEIDATKNGNIAVAVNWLLRNPTIRASAISPQPELVAKTPWNYFGKVVKLTGTVAVVQDFPQGSDFGQSLGGQNASDIVTVTADGTIVELFCMKASGSVKVGDIANLFGYPVGNLDVENRLGGKDPHLILVGNDYDNLGDAR